MQYGYCQACCKKMSSDLCKQISVSRKAGNEDIREIPCCRCKKTLPTTKFAPNQAASAIMGFLGSCRSCLRPIERAKQQKRKEKLAASQQRQDDYSDLV